MNQIPSHRILKLFASGGSLNRLEAVTKALGANTRLAILRYLGTHTCSVLDIADALRITQSTATLHINILERAGLIKTDLQPAKRGIRRVCTRTYDKVVVQIPAKLAKSETLVRSCMPVGAFVDASVVPTCGLLSETGFILAIIRKIFSCSPSTHELLLLSKRM